MAHGAHACAHDPRCLSVSTRAVPFSADDHTQMCWYVFSRFFLFYVHIFVVAHTDFLEKNYHAHADHQTLFVIRINSGDSPFETRSNTVRFDKQMKVFVPTTK